jgi:prephenate dehydrogenase
MTVNITIIGLGQIGGSIGLALGEHTQKLTRTGHDKDVSIARQAEKVGAVDKVAFNLISAVSDADLVILAIPLDQIQDTLELIARDLKTGAVVMDTGPVKEQVTHWAIDCLPEGCYYIGLTPVINPNYLHGVGAGLQAAQADLFHDGLVAIASPPNTSSEAIRLATDLVGLLGASPFFADILEIDGLMAATHLLPQIMAASLINATVDQPGWREAKKIAGRVYAGVTSSLLSENEMKSLGATAVLGRKNVVRVLDNLLAVLQSFRDCIDQEDKISLDEMFERAIQGRAQWWVQRQAANWKAEEMPVSEVPTSGDMLGRLVGIRKKPKPQK